MDNSHPPATPPAGTTPSATDISETTAPQVLSLRDWGWKPFFQQQLSLEELSDCEAARVIAVHRGHLEIAGEAGESRLPLSGSLMAQATENRPTVGDWLLLERDSQRVRRILERSSRFQRMAAGGRQLQLIAANVDRALVVVSCNDDFKLSRIERYLALIRETGCQPFLVLTKADLCADPAPYLDAARSLVDVPFTVVNARDKSSLNELDSWCVRGDTVALLGSSGVGKSTLLNTLSGHERAATQAIREDDAKGRHTTRHRALYPLPGGALLLDSPGIRELGLTGVDEGLQREFEDIDELTRNCRFSNCAHATEPGCAVRAALESGELSPRRLGNWQKLQQETRRNDQTVSQRRASDRSLTRHYKSVLKQSPSRRKGK